MEEQHFGKVQIQVQFLVGAPRPYGQIGKVVSLKRRSSLCSNQSRGTNFCKLFARLKRYMYSTQGVYMSYRDMLAQVRELLGRNLTPNEVAHRLAMSVSEVIFVQKMLTEK